MRLWHPQHGILFTTDQTEIDRLISTGGSEFDVNEKPWIKKDQLVKEKEIEAEEIEEIKPELTINVPKRGRPFKHNGNN